MIAAWLVIPAYNEARGIARELEVLAAFLGPYGAGAGIAFTVLVVDDGSQDDTAAAAEAARATLDARGVALEILRLMRNFGQQAAIIAGLREAAPRADLVITLDADGEHPHTLIPTLIEQWQRGAPLVHTLRRPHGLLNFWKRKASTAYYALIARISRVQIQPGMADFKLWDGGLLRQLAEFLPTCGSTRVFAAWLAPDAPVIAFDQEVAPQRRSRFTLTKNLSLALDGVVRYSDLPLRLSLFMGAFAVLVGIAQSAFVVWASLAGRVVPGWSSVMIIVAFFGAMQSLAIGVLGEYLLRIQFRKSLPQFVARPRSGRMRTEPGSPAPAEGRLLGGPLSAPAREPQK